MIVHFPAIQFSAIQTTGVKELAEGAAIEYDVTQAPKAPRRERGAAPLAALHEIRVTKYRRWAPLPWPPE
ncbi:hypothetical protein [Streptomyces sp. NPDC056682]|uniref:hypothetical protein n=1 Tax=Streptomyces sp. NPDC056682 TaxID=3345909 RepID=UPI003694F405